MNTEIKYPDGYRPLYDGEVIHKADLYLISKDIWKPTACSRQIYVKSKFEPMCRKIKPLFISGETTDGGDFPYIDDFAAFVGADSISYDDDGDTVSVTLTIQKKY